MLGLDGSLVFLVSEWNLACFVSDDLFWWLLRAPAVEAAVINMNIDTESRIAGACILGGVSQHALHFGVWYALLRFFCNYTLDINYCVIINFWVRKCFSCVAFCPYHIGHFSVVGLGFEDYVSADLSSQSDTAVNGRLRINWSFMVSGSCFSLRGPHHHHCGLCPVGSDAHCVPCILSHNHLSLDYRISLEFGWIICTILSYTILEANNLWCAAVWEEPIFPQWTF